MLSFVYRKAEAIARLPQQRDRFTKHLGIVMSKLLDFERASNGSPLNHSHIDD